MEKKSPIIAGALLAIDLKSSAAELGLDVECKFLEAGLHNHPQQLREKLQAALERSVADCRNILGIGAT